MFKQLFASMHDVLDEVMENYPTADVTQKNEWLSKLEVLRSMSDSIIMEWLQFEEKLAGFVEGLQPEMEWPSGAAGSGLTAQPFEEPLENTEAFKKGQGYFQLLMYDHAIREFELLVRQYPEFLTARLYLAMAYMRKGNDGEAYRHFHFITSLSDHSQMKAISFNAMGCIQARNANLSEARELFKKAYQADPTSVEPMINMGICLSHGGIADSGPGFVQ